MVPPVLSPFSLTGYFPNKILVLLKSSLQLLKLTHLLTGLPVFIPASPQAFPH